MVNLDIPLFSKVKVTTAKDSYEGLFMPREADTIVIKLDSGYNVGVLPEHITSIDVLAAPADKSTRADTELEQNTQLPKVSILHTGGTVASRIDYKTGAVDTHFRISDLISLMPEIKDIAQISGTQVGSMWSDDLRFGHINNVAKEIFKQYLDKGTTRFIVTSGTDFTHFLSAGLSFVLKDLPVSVAIVAAQRSSDRSGSDAVMNFMCAAHFLVQQTFHGVVVCMHDTMSDDRCAILPGTNIKKMHSTRRDTFKPINTKALAYVSYPTGNVTMLGKLRTISGNKEKLFLFKENIKVGLVYSHPQFHPEELSIYSKFDGLVIAGSGLGLFQINVTDELTKVHEKNYEALANLAKDIPVVMTTQAMHGRVHMDVYAPGRRLQEIGVFGSHSAMIVETAFVKLAWLLSNFDKKEVRDLYYIDFVGELPQNITDDMFE